MEVFCCVMSQALQIHPVQLREDIERDERGEALSVGRHLVHSHALVLHRDLREGLFVGA